MGIVRKVIGGRRVTEIVEAVRALDEVMPPLRDAGSKPAAQSKNDTPALPSANDKRTGR
ncbi:hypothetical protein [Amycolatopsis sp. NPDC051128]|uniref:hypothetical protein n=1 Tax=Amycolatopsis sp. NPDC051128 TaxID=3155412 RepID=UPI0034294A13